jgi:hypothetical protein
MKKICGLIWLALTMAGGLAQPSGAPSQRAPGDSASLKTTMKLIEDKINEQGEIRYTMISQNTSNGGTVTDQYAVETSHAVADASTCTLQVDAHMVMNGKTQAQGRAGFRFRDLTRLAVKTQSQLIDERTAKAGVTGWKGKIAPESYVLQAFQSGSLSGLLFFRDQDAATVAGQAISRAIGLCGGGKVIL